MKLRAARDFDFKTISLCLCLSPKLTQIGRACLRKDTEQLSKARGFVFVLCFFVFVFGQIRHKKGMREHVRGGLSLYPCLRVCVFLCVFLDESGTKKV